MAVQSLPLRLGNKPNSHPVNHELITVFFRFDDGNKTHTLLVNPFLDDVYSIKKRIASQSTCASSRELFVVSHGKVLSDDCVLADYFLKEGATLFISQRARGGCFMISLSILMIMLLSLIGSTCTCGLSLVVIPFLMPFLFILPLFCL